MKSVMTRSATIDDEEGRAWGGAGKAKRVGVVVAGVGAVGAQLLNVMQHRLCSSSLQLGILAVGDSRGYICGTDQSLAWGDVQAIMAHKSMGHAIPSWPDVTHVHAICGDALAAMEHVHRDREHAVVMDDYLVVDCTCSAQMVPALLRARQLGFAIVMANKLPLSGSTKVYEQLVMESVSVTPMVRSRRVRYEATVGAGLPVMDVVKRMVASRDTVHSIQGSLSGTVAYTLADMNSGSTFSQALRAAHKRGITEADPRDDLSGADVARKMIILARELGLDVDIQRSVVIEPLLPPHLLKEPIDAFFASLPTLDSDFATHLETARRASSTLAYLGTVHSDGRIHIGLEVIPETSVFAHASATEGVISISSEWFPEPLSLRGTGAGIPSTVAALVGDITAILLA